MNNFADYNQKKQEMKRICLILIVLLIQLFNFYMGAQPQIKFDKTEYNFGSVLWNMPVTAQFQITNTGDSPLLLSNVRASCACAVAEWTKNPLGPGQSGIIKVEFDAKALGRFYKEVEVYSNADVQPVYLTLKGRVATEVLANERDFVVRVGDIGLDKNNIEFPDAYWGDVLETEINIMNFSDKPYLPTLMHLPSYLKAEYYPQEIPKNGFGKIKLILDTRYLRNLGLNQTSVYLARFPGDRVREDNEIVVSAILLPELSDISQAIEGNAPRIHLSETDVDMGAFGKKEKLSKMITITNTGNTQLEIIQLQVFNPTIELSLKKRYIPAGGSTKLKVTLSKKDWAKLKSSPRVLMITNDPLQTKIVLNLNATND